MEAATGDHDGRTTTDHDTIRAWVEARGGRLARVADTGEGGGILRIDFQEPDEGLGEIDWETFFDIFEDQRLAFLHQDETAEGDTSRFNRFVSRDWRRPAVCAGGARWSRTRAGPQVGSRACGARCVFGAR